MTHGDRCRRAAVISDNRLYREAVSEALDAVELDPGDLDVTAGGLVTRICAVSADMALVDARMPESITLVRLLCRQLPAVKVLALSVPDGEVIVFAEAGCSGYVPPGAGKGELCRAVATARRGEALCSPRVAAALFDHVQETSLVRSPAHFELLTQRELEILRLVERGLSNKEIARDLAIELQTTKNHVHRILKKLNLRRRAEAGAWFRRYSGMKLDPLPHGPEVPSPVTTKR